MEEDSEDDRDVMSPLLVWLTLADAAIEVVVEFNVEVEFGYKATVAGMPVPLRAKALVSNSRAAVQKNVRISTHPTTDCPRRSELRTAQRRSSRTEFFLENATTTAGQTMAGRAGLPFFLASVQSWAIVATPSDTLGSKSSVPPVLCRIT